MPLFRPTSLLLNEELGSDAGASSGGASEAPFSIGSAMDSIMAEKVEKEPTAAPSPAPAPAGEPSATTPPAVAAEPEWKPKDYPKTWKGDHAEKWKTMSKEHSWLQDEIHRREEDFHKGLEGYRQHAETGTRYQRLIAPYAQAMQQYGVNADQLVANLLNTQMRLAFAQPHERVAMLRQIVSDYKVKPEDLLNSEAPYIDPQVTALRNELGAVKSHLSEQQRREQSQRQDSIRREIDDFSKANPLFAECMDDVAAILRGNPQATLKVAYEQAVWANPVTRAKVLQQQQADAAKTAEKTEKERAEKAAEASKGSVRTPSRSASVTAAAGSMDDTMKETLARIRARKS